MLQVTLPPLLRDVPELALQISPGNADAAVAKADALLVPDAPRKDRAAAINLAQGALMRDPLSAPAARILALALEIEGDFERATRLMAWSAAVSRRDLPTQMWFIENAVQRGDAVGALVHYDLALRTNSRSATLLFPVLINAAGDPRLRNPLADLLARRPPWRDIFLDQLVTSTPNAEGVAHLFVALAHRSDTPSPQLTGRLEQALIERRRIVPAYQLDRALRPDRPAGLRPIDIRMSGSGSPFEWSFPEQDGVETSLSYQTLSLRVIGRDPATVMRQLALLAPGTYEIRATNEGDLQTLRWSARSASDGIVPPVKYDPGRPTPRLVVTSANRAWWIELMFDGQDDVSGATQMRDVRLVRVAS